ncbi:MULTISPECIES: glycerate kinase [unclassified Microbacterium]|uniref:glycerate kinase family protein n=1 Tax=unclassified Microbacterium TaxID=2609290 RepID=UPI000EA9B55B|nr:MULTISPECIES: glycerate kinase [unclassified Microbacterium]MBT2483310.1 glycerate kinase [Microbacterium sp. ISL-108]RKN66347.1 glycerate kinase [Microbacterium sp. CGR2]
MSIHIPQRILVAPSGFKESLSAQAVAQAIAAGVRRVIPGVRVDEFPVPDGGEGTAAALAEATGGELVPVAVTGPVGATVDAHWARLGGHATGTAVVEMASAAGLRLVPRDQRDPGETTTRGVGELIVAALDSGAQRIVVGCGDSGTSDGGAGALVALGARILDREGRPIAPGGRHLGDAVRLDLAGLHPRIGEVEIVLACNIHNVLCGPRGVARVFGPQKGATPEQVEQLASALDSWAALLEDESPFGAALDVRTGGGTGASGGLGAGLAAVLGARLAPRFEVLLDSGLLPHALDELMGLADLVITAEGAIDFQTPRGKVPAEIAMRARVAGVPVLGIAGSLGQGAPDVHDIGIDAIASIITVPMPLAQAVEQGEALLRDAAERSMRMVLLGSAMSARAA